MVELSHDSRPIIGRGTPLGATFLALATASIGLMVADVRYDQLERVRGWMNSAAYPLQLAIDLPFSAWQSISGWFADSDRLRQQNLELTAQLRDANLQLQRFDALEQENQRLREMRGSSAAVAKRAIVASILKVDLDPFRHRVLLDRGASDGVFKGQTVLDAQGIFGQVWRVNARTSEAILISDAEHAIPVKSNRSGVRTIAVGTGDPDRLSLPFITGESDIRKGDLLISTGMGGVFPPGYPVATVTQSRAHCQGDVRHRRGATGRGSRPRQRSDAGVVRCAAARAGRRCRGPTGGDREACADPSGAHRRRFQRRCEYDRRTRTRGVCATSVCGVCATSVCATRVRSC